MCSAARLVTGVDRCGCWNAVLLSSFLGLYEQACGAVGACTPESACNTWHDVNAYE